MQSIGERLEEARKRRGISIREASEATKIRGDFLLNFENNQFEVGLPEIYVRGFLRNYSNFLKIDPEKLVTDYNATLLGESKPVRKDSRELFGRLEIPERPRPSVEGNNPSGPSAPRRRTEDSAEPTRREPNPELANYLKIGAIIVAGVIALLVIVWLLMSIINSASGPSQPGGDSPPAATAPTDTITLIALDSVLVKVTQQSNNEVLFDARLARGERKVIERRGPVLLAYDNGANLQVEVNGKPNSMPAGYQQARVP